MRPLAMRPLLPRSASTCTWLLLLALQSVQGCVTASVVHGQRATMAQNAGEERQTDAGTPTSVVEDHATYALPEGVLTVRGGVSRVELGLVGLLIPIVPIFIHARPEPRDMVEIELRLAMADSAEGNAGPLLLDPGALRLSANGGSTVSAACLVPADDGSSLWIAPGRARCADWRWPRWPFRSFDRAAPAPLQPAPDGALRYELRPGRRLYVLFPLAPDPSQQYELRLEDVRGHDGTKRPLAPIRFHSDWRAGTAWFPAI